MEKLLAYIYSLTCKKKYPDIMYNPPRGLHVSCQSYPRYETARAAGLFQYHIEAMQTLMENLNNAKIFKRGCSIEHPHNRIDLHLI